MDNQVHTNPLDETTGCQPCEAGEHSSLVAACDERDGSHHRHGAHARTWSTRTLVTTGVASFVCGALVWHLVGFWSFISGIVFNPDGAPPADAWPITTQQIAAATGGPRAAHQPALREPDTASTISHKASGTVDETHRPPTSPETLAELLQCAEARKGVTGVVVHACPPLRRRLPHNAGTSRASRQLDASEAARRLADGWQTGVATIETGSLPGRR